MRDNGVFIAKLIRILEEHGFEAVQEPTNIPHRYRWLESIPFFSDKDRYRPDILVSYRNNHAIVEARQDIFPGSVIHAHEYADHFNMDVVLCVPDESSDLLSRSIRRFASDNDVHVCSQSELGHVMDGILKTPSRI